MDDVCIPLDHPIWGRLYGPYGVQDVPAILLALSKDWQADLAKDLFWEKLHHQEDLYPVSYAALPWLWQITKGALDSETAFFISHMLRCAMLPAGEGARFRGLSVKASDHAHGWVPEADHLQAADMAMLEALEGWFAGHALSLARACLAHLPALSGHEAQLLAIGFVAVKGGDGAAFHLDNWPEDTPDRGLDARDSAALVALAAEVTGQNAELDACLRDLLGDALPDPDQMHLPL